MEKDYCKMFNILDEYLKNKVQDIDLTILEAVSARNNGKVFSFEEHLKGFIYAQLSALASWKNIKDNQAKLDELFCNFDCSELKEQSTDFLIEEIKKLKCYSPYTTKNQMHALKANIETFEKIEQDYGNLEKFITHTTPVNIIKLLADSTSNYKLKYSGVALVCEYLRNVGIDVIKPDVHIKRILGAERLNIVKSKSDYAIIAECKKLSDVIGISQVKMDYLLWNYCSKGYGEVCTAKPKCEMCAIRNFCKMNIIKNNQKENDRHKKVIIKKNLSSSSVRNEISDADVQTIVDFCEKELNLDNVKLGREFFYSSLPLCLIDAVFSIGIKYKAVKNVIDRYCYNFNIGVTRLNKSVLPEISVQQSIKDFISLYDQYGLDFMTRHVFRNKNRTSPQKGILKSEAVYMFAKVLQEYGVNHFQDLAKIQNSDNFREDILQIPGQKSGISLQCFFMLASDNDYAFPSRYLISFLSNILNRNISPKKAMPLLIASYKMLKNQYTHLTLKQLDYAIYKHQHLVE